jgi:predicted secreted protein
MAIKNASDLLVYKYTTPAQKQITRIRVLTTDPVIYAAGGTTGNVKMNNVVDSNGDIQDNHTVDCGTNTAAYILGQISSHLVSSAGYTVVGVGGQTDGDYTYTDYQNSTSEKVPTISFTNGTATMKDDAFLVEVRQPGQSLFYEPIAHSTSASITVNRDLRDVTTKDSLGWSESLSGLQSSEISTDALIDLSKNVNVRAFIDDLESRESVILKYSDRIKNIVRTENVWGTDYGFYAESSATISTNYYNWQSPPQQTAAQVTATSNFDGIRYQIGAAELETYGNEFTVSFYVKGVSTNLAATWYVILVNSSGVTQKVLSDPDEGGSSKKLSGDGTVAEYGQYWTISSMSNTTWTRVSSNFVLPTDQDDITTLRLVVFPTANPMTMTTESIRFSSVQLEIGNTATEYENPTEVSCYSGKFLTSSVSIDAGVEENATFSTSFTSTGQIYKDGLGPELVGDTNFNDPSYWTFPGSGGSSVVENGYAKIITSGANTSVKKTNLFPNVNTVSEPTRYKYIMVYTIPPTATHTAVGNISILQGADGSDYKIPREPGTHKIELTPRTANLEIKRSSGATDVWISDISIKEVSPIG